MAVELQILALEPYYGGPRRQMLQTIVRHSRHAWTVLKLPPRRVERRLAAAARWFAELIERGAIEEGGCDVVFGGEMLNLPDLQRIVPWLARVPAVVYFHENQLPTAERVTGSPLELVNLNSAMAASEAWFNSQWHQDQFVDKAAALVQRVPEISGRNPMSEIRGKSMVVPPPVDFAAVREASVAAKDARTLFVDLRAGADVGLLMRALAELEARGEAYHLITVGQRGLPAELRRTEVSERDDGALYRALSEAGVYLGLRAAGVTADELIVPALVAGCRPIVPAACGMYGEALAPATHASCLHDGTVEGIVGRILDAWYTERLAGWEAKQQELLGPYEASEGVRIIDELLCEVAAGKAIRA
jgi:hypothetical protein